MRRASYVIEINLPLIEWFFSDEGPHRDIDIQAFVNAAFRAGQSASRDRRRGGSPFAAAVGQRVEGDLAEVVEIWPKLSAEVQGMLLAAVRAALPGVVLDEKGASRVMAPLIVGVPRSKAVTKAVRRLEPGGRVKPLKQRVQQQEYRQSPAGKAAKRGELDRRKVKRLEAWKLKNQVKG